MKSARKKKAYLSLGAVGLMTAAAEVTSLRGLPLLAKEEMTMFAYLIFTALFYLIPAALVSAELGGMFARERGGLYDWVGSAFGLRWGFLAIWLQWIQNVVWYPVGLAFGAAAIAFTIGDPQLANHGPFVGAFCIIAYWIATVVVMQGARVFALIANWAFLIGTIIPGIGLLALFAYWVGSGHPIAWNALHDSSVSVDGHPRFLPSFHGFGTIAFLAGIILLFAGVEAEAVHVRDMRHPAREYPLAIGLAAIISLVVLVLGAIPVAGILPYEDINLQSGVFDTFYEVAGIGWHMNWLVSLFSFLVAIGALAGVFAWLGSPCRGLLASARDGGLPPFLGRTNENEMPTNILVIQGAVVTLISTIYFVFKDVSTAFFLISAMTVTLYLIAYMLMYAAAIVLRYKSPSAGRPFRIPGGNFGMWGMAGIGFFGVAFSFLVAFFPPTQLPVGSPALYVGLVVAGTIVFCAIPLFIYANRKPEWRISAQSSETD